MSSSDTESLIADAKYGFIAGGYAKRFRQTGGTKKKSEVVDTIITHKVGDSHLYLSVYLTFYGTFKLGQYPMED